MTYTVKIIKIPVIVLTITKTVTSSIIIMCPNKKQVFWNMEGYVSYHVAMPDVTPLFYSQQIKVKFSYSTLRT